MGERRSQSFQLRFNPSLKNQFQEPRVPSEGGLILLSELDERLGVVDLIALHLTGYRRRRVATPSGPSCFPERSIPSDDTS